MKESSKVLIGLGLGLIAGGIAGYLLNSDKGRALQTDTKVKLGELQESAKESYVKNTEMISERVGDVTSTISDKVSSATSTISEKANEASSSAKTWATNVADTVKDKISKTNESAHDLVEGVKDDFQTGAEKARAKINRKAADVVKKVENRKT